MANVGFATLQVIPSFKGAEAALAGGISGPATAAGSKAGGLFAGGLGTALKAAAPAAIVAGVGVGLFKLGSNFQDAFKTIRVTTGQTGSALEGLEGSFKKVLAVRPDSFADVSTAIAKLNQGLGITGKPLETLAAQVLRLSSLTKTDLGANLSATTTLFNAFGVKAGEQGGKLDELFRASQATGVSVAELASSMASGGSLLKTAGLDFEQSAALLGLLGKSGVATSSVMAPLSKAIATAAKSGKTAGDVFKDTFDSIRKAPDATSAAGAAIATFGARAGPKLAGLIREGKLSYEQLAATISSGSDTIAKAGSDTSTLSGKFKILKNAVAVALQPIATRLFDTLNDLAAKALPHVISGVSAFGRGVSSAADVVGPFIGRFVKGIGSMFRSLAPLIDIMKQAFGENDTFGLTWADGVQGKFLVIGKAIRTVADFISANLKPILIGLGVAFVALTSPVTILIAGLILAYTHFKIVRDVVGAVAGFLLGTVAPAVATFATFVADQFAALVGWVKTHWAAISEAIGHVVAVVRGVITAQIAVISAVWKVWGDDLLRVASAVFAQIKLVVTSAVKIIRGVIEFALALINGDWGKAWNALKGVVSAAWTLIKGTVTNGIKAILGVIGGLGNTVTSVASGMFDGIKEAFRSAINWVIDHWNSLSFTLPKIDLPGPGPVFGGNTIGTPHVDRLHGGGDVNVPGGGEALFMLLDGEKVLSPSQAASTRGGDLIVQTVLDGKVIASTVYKEFADRASSEGPFLSKVGAAA